MNLCEHIEDFRNRAGQASYQYVTLAIYGNKKHDDYLKMMAINAMIRSLERQVGTRKTIKVPAATEGSFVSLSALSKSNGLLYLNTEKTYSCLTVESEPCLSDEQICSLIEKIDLSLRSLNN